jgi:hypothetical protein
MEFTRFRQSTKEGKNLFAHRPLGTFESSQICPPVKISHRYAPGGGGELAAGDVGPGLANK